MFLVGNVMIDTLVRLLPKVDKQGGEEEEPFVLVTLHRPSNVDDPARLDALWRSVCRISERIQVVFPVHPRTRAKMAIAGICTAKYGVRLL